MPIKSIVLPKNLNYVVTWYTFMNILQCLKSMKCFSILE